MSLQLHRRYFIIQESKNTKVKYIKIYCWVGAKKKRQIKPLTEFQFKNTVHERETTGFSYVNVYAHSQIHRLTSRNSVCVPSVLLSFQLVVLLESCLFDTLGQ